MFHMVKTNVFSAHSKRHQQSVDACKNVKTKYFLTILNVLYSFRNVQTAGNIFYYKHIFLKNPKILDRRSQ